MIGPMIGPKTRLFLLLVVLPAAALMGYAGGGLKGLLMVGFGFGVGLLLKRTLG